MPQGELESHSMIGGMDLVQTKIHYKIDKIIYTYGLIYSEISYNLTEFIFATQ